MKTNGTPLLIKRISLFAAVIFNFFAAYSQPDYVFQSPVLESGTDLQVGAVYRFSDVKGATDALVEIKNFSGGITLSSIDETWTGFTEAFQPFIYCPAGADGYVEFKVTFVQKGTNTPKNQGQVPVTPIDVDAGQSGKILEQDIIDLGSGAYVDYDFLLTEVAVTNIGGDKYKGKNFAGIGYPGVDTMAKPAMFTVFKSGISSLTVQVGADNTLGVDEIRYRSVYFKKFIYNNPGVLPLSNLLSFNGVSNTSSVNLKWELGKDNNANTIILEKSFTGSDFKPAATFPVTNENRNNRFSYTDPRTQASVVYYRLKLETATGKIEYSNVLSFKNSASQLNTMKVYPTVVTGGQFSVSVSADAKQESMLQVLDYAGRIMYQKKIQLEQGKNNFLVNDFNPSLKGNFVVVTKTNNRTESGKILVQ